MLYHKNDINPVLLFNIRSNFLLINIVIYLVNGVNYNPDFTQSSPVNILRIYFVIEEKSNCFFIHRKGKLLTLLKPCAN